MNKFFQNKKNVIIIILSCIIVLVVGFMIVFSKKEYKAFLELSMPKTSYGYIVYSPGNENVFNIYKNSYLELEYSFSDKKDRDVEFKIDNDNIISIDDKKIYAKENGKAKIYIQTKDSVKSNIITINVVEPLE